MESKYENDYEMKLVRKIMDDYKAKVEVRPVEKSDQPIIVTFDLAYSQLIDLVSFVFAGILVGATVISIGNYTVREVLIKNRTRVWRNVYNTASA